ncbi:MAG: coproporphyrinogen III oxidase family protein [Gammaproteobacteria bacterium]|nr:coproporphyrinogen III oxidase family protein [Gammaproteobacteria bacterium]
MLVSRAFGTGMSLINRRAMSFGPEAAGVEAPTPQSDTNYLLYLHIPFCEALCPFCSFQRVAYKDDKARPYFAALRDEIRYYHKLGFQFTEVYVGGGTPTVDPGELAGTLNLTRSLFPIEQISAETNPNHLESDRLQLLQDCGVNRLSVGVQSFDDRLLRRMQRYDTYGSAEQIVVRLMQADGMFDTLNIDMIFGLPGQSTASLARDLEILRERLAVQQVSFYPLMAARSTRRRMATEMGGTGNTLQEEQYGVIREVMTAPYRPVSAWCFARDAGLIDEYIVNHEEYVGAGSGAFSYVGGQLYASTFSIPRYHRLVQDFGNAITRSRRLSRLEQHRYHFMMTLFGLSMNKAAARARFGDEYFRVLWRELLIMRLLGAIRDDGDTIRLTERGMYYWVIMMREFFTGVNRLRDDMRAQIHDEIELMRA